MSEAVPVGESPSQLHDAELRGQWEQTFVSTARGITIVDPASGIIESTNRAFAAMHGGTVVLPAGQLGPLRDVRSLRRGTGRL